MYVVIGGGGLVGRGLAKRLVETKHDVVVLDTSRSVCESIYGTIGAQTVLGSATDIEVLEDAGIAKADVVAATMRSDADNLAFALLAREAKVPRVFARMRNPKYEAAYKSAGVTRVIDIAGTFAQRLFVEIEQPEIRIIAEMGGGKASLAIVRVGEGSAACEKTVAEIGGVKAFPEECLIVGVYREKEDEFIVPRGRAQIRAGDQVFIASPQEYLGKAAKFVAGKK